MFEPTTRLKVAEDALNRSFLVLKVASPSSVSSGRSRLRQLKEVICSSDMEWETGQVNHRVKEIKDDGRTAD